MNDLINKSNLLISRDKSTSILKEKDNVNNLQSNKDNTIK